MKHALLLFSFGLIVAVPCIARVNAAEGAPIVQASAAFPGKHCPHCQEEVVYQDVVTHRCVMVPDVKQIKKTVYECKEVPFCLHKLPSLFSHFKHDCCDDCPECDCPRYKKVLLKKEIVCKEVCGTKCLIEEVVERVPCRVCRPCPHCAHATPGCALPVPPPVATGSISDGPLRTSSVPSFLPAPPVPSAE
jgi:hypothetical protein